MIYDFSLRTVGLTVGLALIVLFATTIRSRAVELREKLACGGFIVVAASWIWSLETWRLIGWRL